MKTYLGTKNSLQNGFYEQWPRVSIALCDPPKKDPLA